MTLRWPATIGQLLNKPFITKVFYPTHNSNEMRFNTNVSFTRFDSL